MALPFKIPSPVDPPIDRYILAIQTLSQMSKLMISVNVQTEAMIVLSAMA